MKKYIVYYIVGNDTVIKEIIARSPRAARNKAVTPEMLPNEFIKNYERMMVEIRDADGRMRFLLTWKEISNIKPNV